MAHVSATVVDSLSCRGALPGWLLCCVVTWPRLVWRLPSALRLMSPTTFYPCGFRRPSPNALCVFRRLLEGPKEATPSIRRRAAQARIFRGSPLPAPQPGRHAALPMRLPRFEHRPRREHPGFEETPERHESLAGHGHNPNPSQALATAAEALTKPATQGTVRLQAPPTPRQLRGPPAHRAVAGLGHALFSGTRAAVIRRRREAREAPHVPTLLARPPAAKCPHHQPRPIDPAPFALHQLPDFVDAGCRRGLPLGTTRRFHRGTRRTEQRVMGIHPQPPTTQARRHRRAIPPPQGIEWLGPRGQARAPEPLTTEEALDAGRGTGPLLLEGFHVPVPMAVILGLDRGDLDHLPPLALAMVIASEHAPHLAHVQPIALGPPPATVARNV